MYRSVSVVGGGYRFGAISNDLKGGDYGEYGNFSAFCWTRGKTTQDCPPSPAH